MQHDPDRPAAERLACDRAAELGPRQACALAMGDITEKTVKAHLMSAFRRIGVFDRTQAALWAERHGLLERGP
jgi:hypothetical protein